MEEKQVTGRLEKWAFDKKSGVLIGYIYSDAKGRFADGRLIRTSRLMPMSMQACAPRVGAIMATINSTYILGEKK